MYIWMTVATINPDDTLDTTWSNPVNITGEQGPRGETGPAGPAGPIGPSGISGIPGVEIDARYCLGTENTYNAAWNENIATQLNPIQEGWSYVIPSTTKEFPYIWSIQARLIYERDS
jgi:hypothetical protein